MSLEMPQYYCLIIIFYRHLFPGKREEEFKQKKQKCNDHPAALQSVHKLQKY